MDKNDYFCSEDTVLDLLRHYKRVFLLEPLYKRKYVPLGLAKIAQYVKQRGGSVEFGRKYSGQECDLICVTSLFTYRFHEVLEAIEGLPSPVLLGGVCASLLPHLFAREGLYIFGGYSKILDTCVPDYSIDWGISPKWDDWSFTFTQRGCPNKCAYCAVPLIEPGMWINPSWKDHIIDEKSCAMISDNNLSAAPREHVIEVIRHLRKKKKYVMFDNGFDCKHIDQPMAKELATLKFIRYGMRTAFDRIEELYIFRCAIRELIRSGVPASQIMAYVLFNFNDTPQEATLRARTCVKSGILPYPQQYTPFNATSLIPPYIGKHWTKNLCKMFRFFWRKPDYFKIMSFPEFVTMVDRTWPGAVKEEDWDKMERV